MADEQSVERMARNFAERMDALSADDLAATDREIERSFPGGFTDRDEANALVAMAVRNGPIETLHAGKHSALLEDDTLSRITDDEMKVLMVHATRMLAGLLHLRDTQPELYRRWTATYAMMYCHAWERRR